MSLILTAGTKADLVEASQWYSSQQEGLEVRFTYAVEIALRRIEQTPLAFAPLHGNVRHLRIEPFAYALFFEVRGNDIVVVAAIHVRRGPDHIARQLRRPE